MTSLPAVLAVWAGRREAVTPEVIADFAASRDYGLARIAEINAQASLEMHLPAAALSDYLQHNIDFSLGAENKKGLERYYQFAAELGLIPFAKPLDWAHAFEDVNVAPSL
jgi:predicted solute-binding protein